MQLCVPIYQSDFSCIFTARKRSLRRLCFYTCLSVILFTGGRAWPGGVRARGGHACPRGCVSGGPAWPWGGMHGGGHAWGVFMARGCMSWGHACLGGMHGQGACMPCMPPGLILRDTVSQWAGGTHPTGMHSCYDKISSTHHNSDFVILSNVTPGKEQFNQAVADSGINGDAGSNPGFTIPSHNCSNG